ncbi:hypothetical protein WMF31_21450 [Sorangium sp. So ce1036]|uniref:hypothetical protein n=1 Tax=Sorangium sp. So ce1036 TaxID=3133328 RepID=UPI003EFC3F11
MNDRLQTWYSGRGEWTRSVYAASVNSGATPVVRTTRKTPLGGCVNEEAPMERVPAWSVTAELCAELEAQVKMVDGQIQGCITASSAEPLAVFKWTYSGWDSQLNYNVLEYSAGNVIGESGWMPPTMPNGCPQW